MAHRLKLLCILAHPDDESMGTGGILAKYAAEGVATYLITATAGQKGWQGAPADDPGPVALGQIRERELMAAGEALGLHEINLLDYQDGELDQADAEQVISDLVFHIRRIRPQVVVTFDPTGYYGHPDHIAISQFTTAAVAAASDRRYAPTFALPAHRVEKLYYLAPNAEQQAIFQRAFGPLVMTIDGEDRRATPWPDWAITTRVDTSAYWRQVWDAIACHRSQLPGYETLLQLPQADHARLWGNQTFYRAVSFVNQGRAVEDNLFAGLRDPYTMIRELAM